MPEVYDPAITGGGNGFRSRRRRKRKFSVGNSNSSSNGNGNARSNTNDLRVSNSTDDPLSGLHSIPGQKPPSIPKSGCSIKNRQHRDREQHGNGTIKTKPKTKPQAQEHTHSALRSDPLEFDDCTDGNVSTSSDNTMTRNKAIGASKQRREDARESPFFSPSAMHKAVVTTKQTADRNIDDATVVNVSEIDAIGTGDTGALADSTTMDGASAAGPSFDHNYAIALDTRYLDSPSGRDDWNHLRRGVQEFLRSTFRRRGFSVSHIAWTTSSTRTGSTDGSFCNQATRKTTRIVGNSSGGATRITCEWSPNENELDAILSSKIQGAPFRPPINDGNTKNRSFVHLPKGLMANDSWNVFGDLVTAICDDCYKRNQSTAAVPQPNTRNKSERSPSSIRTGAEITSPRIAIFTSDASAFLDRNVPGHQRGIDAFWKKIHGQPQQQAWRKTRIQSVEIVVVTGETTVRVVQQPNNDVKDTNLPNSQDGKDQKSESRCVADGSEADNLHNHMEGANTNYIYYSSSVRDPNDSDSDESSSACGVDKKRLDAIVHTLNRHIENKAEQDFKANRSRIQFDPGFVEHYSRIDIALSIVENSTFACSAKSFWLLCQKWSRNACRRMITAAKGKAEISGLQQSSSSLPMISIQLPETVDFDACEISFNVYYKHMPFRLDSIRAKQAFNDLAILGSSRARMKILRLVPIDSINASLLFGIPVGIKAAILLAEDEGEHREKVLMVQSLLKTLADRDCALLLRFVDDGGLCHDTVDPSGEGILDSSREVQHFFLMPDLVFSKEGPASPRTGVLHRVASADHILEETTASDIFMASNLESASTTQILENSFSEYVKASLDCLGCSPWNPLLQDVLQKNKISPNPAEIIVKKENRIPKYNSDFRTTLLGRRQKSPIDQGCTAESAEVWMNEYGVGSLVRQKSLSEHSNEMKGAATWEDSKVSANVANVDGDATSTDISKGTGYVDENSTNADEEKIIYSFGTSGAGVKTNHAKHKSNAVKSVGSDLDSSDNTSVGISFDDSDGYSSSSSTTSTCSSSATSGATTFGTFHYGRTR